MNDRYCKRVVFVFFIFIFIITDLAINDANFWLQLIIEI